jgi:hypothetical protein
MSLLKIDAKHMQLLCSERLATQMPASSFRPFSSRFDLSRPKNKFPNDAVTPKSIRLASFVLSRLAFAPPLSTLANGHA